MLPSQPVLAIKADGHCCYHLSGVIGSLCRDPDALANGSAACSNDLLRARAQILKNFEKIVAPKRDFFPEPEEWEAHITTLIGESSHEFTQRVSGNAAGKAMHGTNSDLALYTLGEDVRVVVISTSKILSTTPDEKLLESVVLATVPAQCDKSRVVCAVLHKDHFDLGVLRSHNSIQAVFQVGQEWDHALRQLLSFIKSRSPSSATEPRENLGPRWDAAILLADEKKSEKGVDAHMGRRVEGRR